MKDLLGKWLGILVIPLLGGLIVMGGGYAQDSSVSVQGLAGGEEKLPQLNAAPQNTKQSTPARGFGRSYRQQPPLIPHKVSNYQITTSNNACMGCHDWPGHVEAKAPKVSETHYVDRQGARLDQIAGTRYFCMQCHVPQQDAEPLVENTFENAAEIK